MSKVEDILRDAKITELLKKEDEKKKPSKALIIFAVIGVIVAVASDAYGVYRFFIPDYLDDFEDDFEDDFDDDFFEEDDEDDLVQAPKKEAETDATAASDDKFEEE